MITVFESHLPPEFLEAAAAQYNALATLGQAVDVPAAQQAAEPLRAAVLRIVGGDWPGITDEWRGTLLLDPGTGAIGPGVFVFLTRHNRGRGVLRLNASDTIISPAVGLAVYVSEETMYDFKPIEGDDQQVVLWCGP